MLAYFSLLRGIIQYPSRFYAGPFHHFSPQDALCFALITSWIGAAFRFSWNHLIPNAPMTLFSHIFERFQGKMDSTMLEEWLFSAAFTLLDPFFTLYALLISSAVIFLILAISYKKTIPFSQPLKVLAFSSAASVFLILPPGIADLLLMIFTLLLTTLGLREVFKLSTGYSFLLAISPTLVYVGFILIFLIVGLLMAGMFLALLLSAFFM